MPWRRNNWSSALKGCLCVVFGVLVIPVGVDGAVPREAGPDSNISKVAPADLPDRPGLSEAEKDRLVLSAFGECAVGRSPELARQVPTLPADDPRVSNLLDRMAIDDCLRGGRLALNTALMRGSVFVALYRKAFARVQPPVAAQPTLFDAEVREVGSEASQQYIALRRFGDCVVRRSVETSRALILARPATKTEAAAFVAITPHLAPCIAAGSRLTFSKLVLAGVIGEALYRLSVRPPAAELAG